MSLVPQNPLACCSTSVVPVQPGLRGQPEHCTAATAADVAHDSHSAAAEGATHAVLSAAAAELAAGVVS